MTLLQKSILSTIAYYDTLDHPLTSFEVFKYLVNPLHITSFYYSKNKEDSKDFEKIPLGINRFSEITLGNIIKNLPRAENLGQNRELKNLIEEKNGFYFLKGREKIVRVRIERQKIADQKWKKAKKIIRWLQIIPYLRMVAVSGSLALNNTREESDFDLFIVVKNKRIWLSRFLITLFVQLMGKRRYKNFTKDRICLNHYVTDKSLEIKYASLSNAQINARLIPVLEIQSGIYNKFQKANDWVKLYLVFYPEAETKNLKYLKVSPWLRNTAKIGEACLNNKFGDWIENIFRKLQKRLIKKNPLTYKKGGRVVIDDEQLEFHPNARERQILDKYNETMVRLGMKELSREKDSGLL